MKTDILSEKLSLNGEQMVNRLGQSAESRITEEKSFDNLDNNGLLLREIYFNTRFRNHITLKNWFQFLSNSVYIDLYNKHAFSPGKLPLTLDHYLKEKDVEEINAFFEAMHFNQRVEFAKQSVGERFTIRTEEDKIFFKREGVGEPIPYEMESLGNQNLLILLPAYFHVIKNGGMLIVDEFSSGFHNFLEELLVKYFMKHTDNSQLFLVSHSTNLLSNTILRPDQIYAASFNDGEGTHLKRLSSEKPRAAQNLERMYINGIFGGLPEYHDVDYDK